MWYCYDKKKTYFTYTASLIRSALPSLKQVLSPSQNARRKEKLSPRSNPVKCDNFIHQLY